MKGQFLRETNMGLRMLFRRFSPFGHYLCSYGERKRDFGAMIESGVSARETLHRVDPWYN